MIKNKEILDWIKHAESDLAAAGVLLEKGGFAEQVIFHCHDALEKFLKALIQTHGNDFPYVHNLDILLRKARLENKDSIRLSNVAIILEELYPFARYPERGSEISQEKAKETYLTCREAEKILKKYFS